MKVMSGKEDGLKRLSTTAGFKFPELKTLV